ncbi:MAG: Gfo/Idh/MocA family protein [Limnochordia bacterium]|jgi:predicted dehydrogenase
MKRINVGVIGFGGRGRSLALRFHKHPDTRIAGVADPSEAGRERAGEDFPEAQLFASTEEMVKNGDIDAVVITSPDYTHYENAVLALQHRKHVLVEKPMAQTIQHCDDMITAWHSLAPECVFMVGLELRYCSLFVRIRELLKEGVIGRVIMGHAVDNVATGHTYFHRPYRSKSYVRSLLLQKGVHTIDLLNWLMDARPTRVYATGGLNVFGGDEPEDKECATCDIIDTCPHAVTDPEKQRRQGLCVYSRAVDVEDNSMALIEYEGNARAVYTECHFTPEYTREFTFIGDKGKLYGYFINSGDYRVRIWRRFSKDVEEFHVPPSPGSHGGGDDRLFEDFITCIKTGRQPEDSIVVARDSTAIAAAAAESIERRVPVEIPPCPVDPR